MSASLVGSEMCIRDSCNAPPARDHLFSPCVFGIRAARTHLTPLAALGLEATLQSVTAATQDAQLVACSLPRSAFPSCV
eukprot:204453-Alexandrium_andersonii.AAC.1